jgi:hypothetical protein
VIWVNLAIDHGLQSRQDKPVRRNVVPLKILSAVIVLLAFVTTASAQTAPPLWMNKDGAKPTFESVEIHRGPLKVGDVAASLEATHLRTARLASAFTLEAANITFPKGTPFFASPRPLYISVAQIPGSPPTTPLPKTIGDLQWCSMKPERKTICFTCRDDGVVLNSLFPTQPIPSRFGPPPGSPGPIPDLVEEPVSLPPLKSTI